jgi:hypothetical protein
VNETKVTQLMSRIRTLIPSLDGWCTAERACEYAAMIVGLRLDLTVCLGVWGGRDVLAMALAHEAIGLGRVLAVDAWRAADSVEGQSPANQEWWASQEMHERVYQRFLQTVREQNMGGFVEVHRARTRDVTPPDGIGLLIVDGNHGPEALHDIQTWSTHVRPGGIVYCDDVSWDGGSVQAGVDWLETQGFRRLYFRDSGLFLQKLGGES